MLNSVAKLSHVRPGFDADHLLTFRVALTGSNYAPESSRVTFVSDLLGRLGSMPGVRRAAVTTVVPFGGTRNGNAFTIEGRPRKPGELQIADQRHVSPDYFETMHIPLVKGRLFQGT